MAEKRMFSKTITESDAFLDLPLSTQALYFHLCIHADDDGFLGGYKKIMRMIGAAQNEYDLLIAKSFLIEFDDGIVVIKHWLMHNYIRKDRYKPTVYLKEREMLFLKENKAYTLDDTQGLPLGTPLGIPTVDVDKNRLDKNRLDKNREQEVSKLLSLYQQDIQQMPAKTVLDGLMSYYEIFGYEMVEHAINQAAKQRAHNYAYIEGIFKNWLRDDIKSIEQATNSKKHKDSAKESIHMQGIEKAGGGLGERWEEF